MAIKYLKILDPDQTNKITFSQLCSIISDNYGKEGLVLNKNEE